MAQRIVFPARGRVALQSFDLPSPGPNDVRVRTLCSLISTGTETTILHQKYAPGTHFDRLFGFPQLKTGVQAVGVIESVGEQVTEFRPGERVFMRMAHGSHQVLEARLVSPVPDGIDSADACWCGLAKTAFRAAHAGPFTEGGSVLIIGAGPVGQMALRWAASMAMQEIAVVDIAGARLEHARRGGATVTLHGSLGAQAGAIAHLNRGSGPPLVIDTTGNAAVFADALAVIAQFGKLILLGDSGFPGQQCLTSDLMTRGLTVQAVHDSHDRDGWTQRRVDSLFFERVTQQEFSLEGLISHRFRPEDCGQAYALATEQRDTTMGILFQWAD